MHYCIDNIYIHHINHHFHIPILIIKYGARRMDGGHIFITLLLLLLLLIIIILYGTRRTGGGEGGRVEQSRGEEKVAKQRWRRWQSREGGGGRAEQMRRWQSTNWLNFLLTSGGNLIKR